MPAGAEDFELPVEGGLLEPVEGGLLPVEVGLLKPVEADLLLLEQDEPLLQ